jgi:hypothetical protein
VYACDVLVWCHGIANVISIQHLTCIAAAALAPAANTAAEFAASFDDVDAEGDGDDCPLPKITLKPVALEAVAPAEAPADKRDENVDATDAVTDGEYRVR